MTSVLELDAIDAIASRIGVDSALLAHGRPGLQGDQTYRVLNARGSELDALAISRQNGHFGNNFKQLCHAVRLAKTLGVSRIYVPRLMSLAVPDGRLSLDDLEWIAYSNSAEVAGSALWGTFFYREQLGDALAPDAIEQQRLVNEYISPLCPALQGVEAAPPHHLAIHIRSGDLFSRPNPHPRYPQPPLALYRHVVDDFLMQHRDGCITIVFQDRKNPTVNALETELRARNVLRAMQSSTLDEDLRTLFAHQSLVFGRGTFGKAVAILSRHVRQVYFPWTDADFRFALKPKAAKARMVVECEPRYIEIGAWKNTPEQLDLMLNYDASNLSFDGSHRT